MISIIHNDARINEFVTATYDPKASYFNFSIKVSPTQNSQIGKYNYVVVMVSYENIEY